MSKSEILRELPNLTKAERHEVRMLLTKLDGEEWFESANLTDNEKALLDSRIADYKNNPQAESSWEEADKRLIELWKIQSISPSCESIQKHAEY